MGTEAPTDPVPLSTSRAKSTRPGVTGVPEEIVPLKKFVRDISTTCSLKEIVSFRKSIS